MFSLTFGTKCGALAAILTIAAAVLSTPASATNVSEAVALCRKNPNCHISGQGKGGTVLCIGKDPRGGCASSVVCDPKSQGGKCWAAKKAPGGSKPVRGVAGTAQQPPKSPPKAGARGTIAKPGTTANPGKIPFRRHHPGGSSGHRPRHPGGSSGRH